MFGVSFASSRCSLLEAKLEGSVYICCMFCKDLFFGCGKFKKVLLLSLLVGVHSALVALSDQDSITVPPQLLEIRPMGT